MRSLVAITCFAATLAAAPKPTFHKDVVPLLQKHCQSCHRQGEVGPMPFLSYSEVRPWAKQIKAAVLQKRMPPWFADAAHGKFANDRSLTRSEIDILAAWADTGAAEGNAKDAPKPREFTAGWSIPQPELVLELPSAIEVPAKGTIEYTYVVVPSGFTEDKWVRFAEARPGNRQLVHHIIAFVRAPGSKWLRDAIPGVPYIPKKQEPASTEAGRKNDEPRQPPMGEFLVGYAPGVPPTELKPGQAKLIPAGSDIVFQLHYTANGTAGTDRSKVGFVFAKEPPTERVLTLAVGNQKFAIPPGAANHRVDADLTLHADTRLVAMIPHMHLRGKSFEMRAVYPTGESEILLNVPRYDFNWQLSYEPVAQKVLPKGTRIEAVAHYDNSPNNPHNPDPKAEVRYGDQSWEEMMFGFFDVAFDTRLNPADLLRAPQAARASN